MRLPAVIALAAIVAATTPATRADSVRGVRVLDQRPLVVRGGVLMVPLGAERHGDRWPATLPIALPAGATIEGRVAWIHAAGGADAERRWTEDLPTLAVRAITRDDDSSRGDGYPILIARIPAGADGPLRIGAQPITPMWLDPPSPGTIGAAYELEPVDRPDRPDPRSPFAYWRWALIADRIGAAPFAPDVYGEVGALVAEHQAELWLAALRRLAAASPGVASACHDLLTRTCREGDVTFAAWVTGRERLEPLFTTLLDAGRSPEDVAIAALTWADAQTPLLVWTEVAFGASVRVAIVNRGTRPLIARLGWAGSDDPPIAVELPPGELSRVSVDRPPPREAEPRAGAAAEAREPRHDALFVSAGGQELRINVGPSAVEMRPPGATFPAFRAPVTLAEVEAGRQRVVPLARATSLQVRRRAGRWEAFVECRRPPLDEAARPDRPGDDAAAGGDVRAADLIARATHPDDLRGAEAIVLFIGEEEAGGVALVVPESGPLRLLGGGAPDPGVSAHRRSYADRWLCRIVLPDSWIAPPLPAVDPLFTTPQDLARQRWCRVGCLRTHGDSTAIETAPGTGVPWRQTPARAALDPSRWADLP